MTAILLFAAQAMTFSADSIAVDNVTKAAVASGHVHAVSGVYTLRGDYMQRDQDGIMHFRSPMCVTTCTNDVGHTHWNVTGDVQYRERDFVIVKNAWLNFYEIPVFYLPYLYYPLDYHCGFSWMPGYLGRWGAYLMTQYRYHLIGDKEHKENTYWLKGVSRLDVRYRNGVAVGQDFKWNLGDFGRGNFESYYAWDRDANDRYNDRAKGNYKYKNWGSLVEDERYILGLKHFWEATERDQVFVRGSYLSDSYFRNDFLRTGFFNLKSQWIGYQNSGVTWEHLEDVFSFGVEATGRLNEFYGMVGRLPEVYFNVNPTPLFDLPANYESSTKIGRLTRDFAEYASGRKSVFGTTPGVWAEYESFRFDTYHRITMPFKIAKDVISVVPRVGYRGTWWDETGFTDLTGQNDARDAGAAFRSIGEFGATFAARGEAAVNEKWNHMLEPYFDLLLQKAWYGGLEDSARPYVFDNLDASLSWEDQFAGRSRNLPYSYYGVTPGVRNVWSRLEEDGSFRQIVDFDFYISAQFNSATYLGKDRSHRLAKHDGPNYGSDGMLVPGVRVRYSPIEDTLLSFRGEYDSQNDKVAYAGGTWNQKLSDKFDYYISYELRDHRYWDFSSFARDEFNFAKMHSVEIGCKQDVCDWLAWSPFVRWDLRENEFDVIGAWVDYLTDCLGFRWMLEYNNEYTTIDKYHHKRDFSVGFYVYLRAFGSDSGSMFKSR